MVTLIDYGGSNLRSVQKALEHVGAQVQVSGSPKVIRRAERLVLPGVGAFGAGMAALEERGLDRAVQAAVSRGALLLGICLGMQFLFEASEEMGEHRGLGLVSGRVVRFAGQGLKVPHMGWNQIKHDGRHPLLEGVPDGAHAYFVHSYFCRPAEPDSVVAYSDYGARIAAVIAQDNVFGIQFHPEKSQRVGLQILRNFLGLGG